MNPLVSFCVKSYNQRRYLKAALEGALAQTYRPLEIVLSDDGSTDGSWELIQEIISNYKKTNNADDDLNSLPQPQIVLNRNEQNLGNLGNWERICELAHGELLIKADGDDISLPERTSVIVEAWKRGDKKAYAVCHSGWQILPSGKPFGRLRFVTAGWPLGAAMAYSPELFKRFPMVGADYRRCMDDEIYARRARMLGGVLEISDRLVYYRLGAGATSSIWKIRNQIRFCNRDSLKTLDISEKDLASLNVQQREVWQKFVDVERRRLMLNLCRLDSPSFAERWQCTRELGRHPFFSIAHYMSIAFTMPRLVGDVMLFLYALLRNAYWRIQGIGSRSLNSNMSRLGTAERNAQ